jgi:hypothetical protein
MYDFRHHDADRHDGKALVGLVVAPPPQGQLHKPLRLSVIVTQRQTGQPGAAPGA